MWLVRRNNNSVANSANWMNNFFNDFWRNDLTNYFSDFEDDSVVWSPRADIEETENAYRVLADLPGIDKKDLKVSMHDHTLTISAERKHEKEEKEKDSYYRKERAYGSFQRSFTFPNHVKTDGIKADYKNGVLSVEVPKSETALPKLIEVK